jgi:hypothetical protein
MADANLPGNRHLVQLTRGATSQHTLPATAARARARVLRLFLAGLLSAVIAVLITGQFVPATHARPGPPTPQAPHGLVAQPQRPEPGPPAAPAHAALQAAAAVSATDVWAVGSGASAFSTVYQPLIEHWNGSTWSVVRSPRVGSGADTAALAGIAALGKTNAWAVGNKYNGTTTTTLVEHWNGAWWSIVPSPNPTGASSSQLLSVAAVSATDVWAVGYWLDSSGWHTLAEHWNGSAWSLASTPGYSGPVENYLFGVTAITSSDVWAVGYDSNIQGYIANTLVEQWNGSKWAIVPSADTHDGASADHLYAVVALSASNIWAVGDGGLGGPSYSGGQTLIEQWNGSQWSIVTSPNSANAYDSLASVAAVSATDLWTVGNSSNIQGVTSTLIEQWNTSGWSIVPSPSPRWGPDSDLAGVAAVSASDVWAVGTAGSHTLVEHWNGTKWQIVPSP